MPTRVTEPDPITVLDLFAGCGGLTEGLHQFRPEGATSAAFRSVGAVEWEPAAAASYAHNFGPESKRPRDFAPTRVFACDIEAWNPDPELGEIDVVVGGPPCQGFSGLNRGGVGAHRNRLWEEFVRVVVAVRPKVFVIENVDRFVRSPEFADLRKRIGDGDLRDYRLIDPLGLGSEDRGPEYARNYVLNAADFGAMQARRRAIVIGVRTDVTTGEEFRYPSPSHARQGGASLPGLDPSAPQRAPWRTVDALFAKTRGLDLHSEMREAPSVRVDGVQRSIPGPYLTSELHVTRNPELLSLARYDAIPQGGNRKNLGGRYVCRFSGGRVVVLEKVGEIRDENKVLLPDGLHVQVVRGVATSARFLVCTTDTLEGGPAQSGRSRTHAFEAIVQSEGDAHGEAAVLEYLSTDSWDSHRTGAGDVMGRLRLGSPSVTIRTEFFKPEKGRYLHPIDDRPITPYEAAIIQGFPEKFRWCGTKTEISRQIGNAVPIPLGVAIARSIHEYLRPGQRASA